ncbi:Protein-glutamine gamma-glutamyltransferase 5 [Thelohanellus kitauei]|uniref:Protein-glutamine gamma-glutamyltransferase 5 n=1 Tax=Thelohanellus kitauei TaxID=669202 RepID=A0A0C2MLY4_THEKT|nr:Protein-glutamine gamma-glutamyltransferase 5 [Thelohanellus kitauei]
MNKLRYFIEYKLFRNTEAISQKTIFLNCNTNILVNANDDRGLLVGNWHEVKDGVPATQWTRAIDIYTKYLVTGMPVKWGQCFVFAMMLTSMCRNVGIVCRAVSGFDIGHDNNKNGIIEVYTDSRTLEFLPGSEIIW